jgi:serine/threonine protein kinase
VTSRHYTPKSDVYSYGILLWELIARDIPFKEKTYKETVATVRDNKRPEMPAYCPNSLKELIEQCWHQGNYL